MADSRTIRKRDGQVKTITDLVAKGRNIMEDSGRSRNPVKEMLAVVKNIRHKKVSIDELNEEILNFVDEELIGVEIATSSDLDVFIDTELEILEGYLSDLKLDEEANTNRNEEETMLRRNRDTGGRDYANSEQVDAANN